MQSERVMQLELRRVGTVREVQKLTCEPASESLGTGLSVRNLPVLTRDLFSCL